MPETGHKPHSLENITQPLVDGRIIHYTCNAPDLETCAKYGIEPIGNKFGCANEREVVLIPPDVIAQANGRDLNLNNLVLDCEQALQNLDRK